MNTPRRWLRLREASAASASPALQRGGPPNSTAGDGNQKTVDCPDCDDGTRADGSTCTTCNGTGTVREADDVLARLSKLEGLIGSEARLREAKPGVLNTQISPMTRVQTGKGQEGYQVVLIREGKGNADDGNWYTADAIKELCESGVAEGMQAYANHPALDEEETRPERDVRQLVGTYHDVKFAESAGRAQADAVFVPIEGPGYEWVTTLAEAAVNNRGPQPLAGISLYGLSAGDYGDRPDGTQGRVVTLIRPTSGDIVTNAGAGGEFVRRLMESARALRQSNKKEQQPMKLAELKQKMSEATTRLREADSDEKREAAIADLEALDKVEVETASTVAPTTIEQLTEAAPALVAQLREAASADAGKDKAELETQLTAAQGKLREAERTLSQFSDVIDITKTLRECEVDDDDVEWFLGEARSRNLREAADIKRLVESQRSRDKRSEERIREALGVGGDIEGHPAREPVAVKDGGRDLLREAGIPVTEAA